MFVAVEQRVFLLAISAWSAISATAEDSLVGLETGVGEDDDQSFRVFVGGWNRNVLLGDQLRELWWGEGLRSCHSNEDQLLCEELC